VRWCRDAPARNDITDESPCDRLSLELLRVAVSLPMAIDMALQQEAAATAATERERAVLQARRKSILPSTVGTLLRSVVYVLERSERILS